MLNESIPPLSSKLPSQSLSCDRVRCRNLIVCMHILTIWPAVDIWLAYLAFITKFSHQGGNGRLERVHHFPEIRRLLTSEARTGSEVFSDGVKDVLRCCVILPDSPFCLDDSGRWMALLKFIPLGQ